MRPGGGDAGHESLAAGVQSLLESLPWTRDAAVAERLRLTNDLEKDGVGLRAHEMLQAAVGQLPKDLPEIMNSAVYPPRVRNTTISN